MSTEHQQYSTENQSAAIQKYAELHGYEIVQTYMDTARSGVILKHRTGLQQLLQDVVRGDSKYRVILVYDVSRWGRFQDTDESAHYEFLCKSAGVPVHYCAETFANDGSLPSLIMKALKRTMAGEYSRELGVKVLAGQKRLALLGFKQGGRPGYGLRRLLVSPNRTTKQFLEFGERKSITTDRVILVPGPPEEVENVQELFRLLVSGERTVYGIAREFNRRGIKYLPSSKWDYQAVYNILTHPKYSGRNVYCRTARKLYTPTIRLPRCEWVEVPNAFEPIVDFQTFEKAQEILGSRTFNKSNDYLLNELQALLAAKGRVTRDLIQSCPNMASPSTYITRFGSLRRAYELIGYHNSEQFEPLDMRRRTFALRQRLLRDILEALPNEIQLVKRNNRWRDKLRLPGGNTVSLAIARAVQVWNKTTRWLVDPHPYERRFVTLLARLDEENSGFFDFHVMPCLDRPHRYRLALKDPWFKRGQKLENLSELIEVVTKVRRKLK